MLALPFTEIVDMIAVCSSLETEKMLFLSSSAPTLILGSVKLFEKVFNARCKHLYFLLLHSNDAGEI